MDKRKYLALFLGNFASYVAGAGVLPLLPIYAAQLGAPTSLTGYYLAFASLALTAGTVAGGWLSDRFGRRRALLALAGLLAVPSTWAMGHVSSLWSLTLITTVVWFLGGIGVTMTSILAGLFAGSGERGKVYGFLSLAAGVGSLTAGLIVGSLADRWGYPTMFALLSLFYLLWPAAALVIRDQRADRGLAKEGAVASRGVRFGKSFYALFAASLMAAVSDFVRGLSLSLSMDVLGFSAAAISSTLAISSAIALPLPLLVGRLSDRLGRKRFLILSCLLSTVGLVILSQSSLLWHFWIAVALSELSVKTIKAIGPALANDLLPRESLDRGLGLYGATSWIGAIIGFAGTGQAVQCLGLTPTLIGGAALPLVSILLLVLVRQPQDRSQRSSSRLESDQAE